GGIRVRSKGQGAEDCYVRHHGAEGVRASAAGARYLLESAAISLARRANHSNVAGCDQYSFLGSGIRPPANAELCAGPVQAGSAYGRFYSHRLTERIAGLHD